MRALATIGSLLSIGILVAGIAELTSGSPAGTMLTIIGAVLVLMWVVLLPIAVRGGKV